MTKDYTALDAAITARIKDGWTTFWQINARGVSREARLIAQAEDKSDVWRIVDRRLQALRKKGVIEFIGCPRGWYVKQETTT